VATIIRIYLLQPDGTPSEEFHAFSVNDFAGHPPLVGDIILPSMGVETGPAEDEVWEVVSRYQGPGRPFDGGACLRVVARPRALRPDEEALRYAP
jgi:hypothetical protein